MKFKRPTIIEYKSDSSDFCNTITIKIQIYFVIPIVRNPSLIPIKRENYPQERFPTSGNDGFVIGYPYKASFAVTFITSFMFLSRNSGI